MAFRSTQEWINNPIHIYEKKSQALHFFTLILQLLPGGPNKIYGSGLPWPWHILVTADFCLSFSNLLKKTSFLDEGNFPDCETGMTGEDWYWAGEHWDSFGRRRVGNNTEKDEKTFFSVLSFFILLIGYL